MQSILHMAYDSFHPRNRDTTVHRKWKVAIFGYGCEDRSQTPSAAKRRYLARGVRTSQQRRLAQAHGRRERVLVDRYQRPVAAIVKIQGRRRARSAYRRDA